MNDTSVTLIKGTGTLLDHGDKEPSSGVYTPFDLDRNSLVRNADGHTDGVARSEREPLVADAVLERALDQVEELLAVVVPVQRVGVTGGDRHLPHRHPRAWCGGAVDVPAQLAEVGDVRRDVGLAMQTALLHENG